MTDKLNDGEAQLLDAVWRLTWEGAKSPDIEYDFDRSDDADWIRRLDERGRTATKFRADEPLVNDWNHDRQNASVPRALLLGLCEEWGINPECIERLLRHEVPAALTPLDVVGRVMVPAAACCYGGFVRVLPLDQRHCDTRIVVTRIGSTRCMVNGKEVRGSDQAEYWLTPIGREAAKRFALPSLPDDPAWQPASWFSKKLQARLRQAASPRRKSKHVRKNAFGHYSAADAHRNWPKDVPNPFTLA